MAGTLNGRLLYVTERPTIIFGAEVTHPQPGEDSSPSIAAVGSVVFGYFICIFKCYLTEISLLVDLGLFK